MDSVYGVLETLNLLWTQNQGLLTLFQLFKLIKFDYMLTSVCLTEILKQLLTVYDYTNFQHILIRQR